MRRSLRLASWLVVGVAALASAAVVTAAPRSHARQACAAGVTTFGGVNARVFCGPAKATVKIGGKTLTFKGGSCERTATYLSLNIGTVVLGQTTKKKPDYFGVDVGAFPGSTSKPAGKDGRYTSGVFAVEFKGKGYLLRGDTAHITLSGGRTRGSFTAAILLGSGSASGTFHC